MITITAILRARPGTAATMRQALLDVAANVAANEPGTLGFFISRKVARYKIGW
jgi:quinol monooxygenase YgiN